MFKEVDRAEEHDSQSAGLSHDIALSSSLGRWFGIFETGCYRDGIGVKKDFFGMITMAHMAEWRGAINRMDDYIYGLPDGHEYKTLFLLMDGYKSYIQEGTDSVEHVLCNNDSPEAKTLLGIITIDKGDTISGMNMVKDAAEQGCSLAELLLTIPDWKGRLRADATKLGIIAHRVPLSPI